MAPSDSPDFEFDVSDLEVEGNNAPASEQGESMPRKEQPKPTQPPEKEPDTDAMGSFEDDGDEELEGFAIDELPSETSAQTDTPQAGDQSAEHATVEDPSVPDAEVTRIESEQPSKPSRTLGDDDLGADVFAEMDDDSGVMSFEDVIDDLMDEVDEFEAGGFVELDDEESKSGEKADDDGLFKLEDPDDSLVHSIDPNAEPEEAPQANSPAFPSPPMDFEIPADPEPEEDAEPIESIEQETAEVATDNSNGLTAPEASVEDVAPAIEAVEPTVAPVTPAAEVAPTPTPKQEAPAPDFSEMEIPADPPQAESPPAVLEGVEVAEPEEPLPVSQEELAPEPLPEESPASAEAPEDSVEAVASDESVASIEEEEIEEAVSEQNEGEEQGIDLLAADVPEVVDGPEQVLFSADEEESVEEIPADDAEPVDEGDTPEVEEESVVAEIDSDEDDLSFPDIDDLISDEIADDVTAEAETESPASDGSAIEEEPEAAEPSPDLEEIPTEAVESTSDTDSAGEIISDESESSESESEEAAPLPAPELSVLDDEEDEDLSDLVAAALDEEDEEEVISETVAETSETPSDIDNDGEPADEEVIAEMPEEEDDDLSDLIAAAQEEALEEVEEIEAPAIADEEEIEAEAAVEESEETTASEGAETPEPVAEVPGLQMLDDDEEEPAAAEAPGLAILEDEEEEIAESDEAPVAEVPGLVEVPEEEELIEGLDEEPEETVAAVPSAEDLLKQAGGLLSGDGKKPADDASDLLDALGEDEEEEVVAMPDPASMIADAADSEEDEDDGVVAMPDPAALISDAGETETEEEEEKSGNVADRGGDLPPPPPAPVEIIDEEPPEEDEQEAVAADDDDDVVSLPSLEEINEPVEASAEEPQSESDLEDPFSAEISLDDFDEGLEAFDDLDGNAQAEGAPEGEASDGEAPPAEGEAAAEASDVIEMPKPSLIWRITHSMAVAAGLVLIGLASVLAVWKQQIVEYIEGRDLDGSAMVQQIREIGTHALSELDENGLYRMQWVDSEVKRVSEDEIRLHALVGAQLRENLYEPVLESELEGELFYDDRLLMESLALAHDRYPEEIGRFPEKPWHSLYRLSTPKDEILPLKVTYAVTRESAEKDWELSRIKVSGYREELKWPEGQPRLAFGDHAYDIESEEFKELVATYREDAASFIATVERHASKEEEAIIALKQENEKQRQRVRMALAEGSYFNGVAIIGEDAAKSRDVQLVITEVRDEGAFLKGVVRTGSGEEESAKMFVGNLDFEKTFSGREQGVLNLTTVSLDLANSGKTDAPFFNPKSVTRMRLKADGFRLEGDSRDLSLRLTRSM